MAVGSADGGRHSAHSAGVTGTRPCSCIPALRLADDSIIGPHFLRLPITSDLHSPCSAKCQRAGADRRRDHLSEYWYITVRKLENNAADDAAARPAIVDTPRRPICAASSGSTHPPRLHVDGNDRYPPSATIPANLPSRAFIGLLPAPSRVRAAHCSAPGDPAGTNRNLMHFVGVRLVLRISRSTCRSVCRFSSRCCRSLSFSPSCLRAGRHRLLDRDVFGLAGVLIIWAVRTGDEAAVAAIVSAYAHAAQTSQPHAGAGWHQRHHRILANAIHLPPALIAAWAMGGISLPSIGDVPRLIGFAASATPRTGC